MTTATRTTMGSPPTPPSPSKWVTSSIAKRPFSPLLLLLLGFFLCRRLPCDRFDARDNGWMISKEQPLVRKARLFADKNLFVADYYLSIVNFFIRPLYTLFGYKAKHYCRPYLCVGEERRKEERRMSKRRRHWSWQDPEKEKQEEDIPSLPPFPRVSFLPETELRKARKVHHSLSPKEKQNKRKKEILGRNCCCNCCSWHNTKRCWWYWTRASYFFLFFLNGLFRRKWVLWRGRENWKEGWLVGA